jgi:hypothetical protein
MVGLCRARYCSVAGVARPIRFRARVTKQLCIKNYVWGQATIEDVVTHVEGMRSITNYDPSDSSIKVIAAIRPVANFKRLVYRLC